MNRVLSVLIILGIIIWGFLMWDRTRPDMQYQEVVSQVHDANEDDRCKEFRQTDEEDESTWSLGYKGRIKQLLNWCF